MKSLLAVLVLVIVVARTSSAQPGATEPIPPGAMENPPVPAYGQQRQQPQVAQKSESTALWLSLGGTIGSYALLLAPGLVASSNNDATVNLAGSAASVGAVGTLLAPTFGHWYAGKGFTRGFGLRLGAIGVGFLGLVIALSGCSLSFGHEEDAPGCGPGGPLGVALLIGAGGMWVGGTVDDIAQAPRRVRRRNQAAMQVGLTPVLHGDRVGFALVGAF